ncbi:hypothetical protein M2D07_003285 [Pseudomonas sp. BGr12]|uniref:hypothetical protein n=1 Tax=unclassified Pseudomonas TaxID=196821 RepID=UPI001782CEAF|nr:MULTISPECIES: hypothetical protein [unclassified Pseudomonas]MBD9502945.1 hypothetical protein [Pseudomonas sp. PDM17]MBD9574581.1 hypothetical protein [Pseudomonas sp. PDM23]MBD9673041.1 hypothetical protein [Pseudomonas sp. PDM21]MDL2426039.1 hypothetical protein [Pseudomonas sp. BJa5]
MLLFYLLLILVTAIVANVQLHKWKRQRRMDVRAAVKSRKKPAAKKKAPAEDVELDEIDWDGLDQEELDFSAPPPPAPKPLPASVPAAALTQPPAEAKSKVEPKDEFFALERALPPGQLTAAQRDEAMAQLLKTSLHLPTPEPGEKHVVLDMDDGSYVPVATHPAAAAIALGHLAESLQQRKGAQLLRELRGKDLGLLVVARNPQKPSVARLWKIQPEDL